MSSLAKPEEEVQHAEPQALEEVCSIMPATWLPTDKIHLCY